MWGEAGGAWRDPQRIVDTTRALLSSSGDGALLAACCEALAAVWELQRRRQGASSYASRPLSPAKSRRPSSRTGDAWAGTPGASPGTHPSLLAPASPPPASPSLARPGSRLSWSRDLPACSAPSLGAEAMAVVTAMAHVPVDVRLQYHGARALAALSVTGALRVHADAAGAEARDERRGAARAAGAAASGSKLVRAVCAALADAMERNVHHIPLLEHACEAAANVLQPEAARSASASHPATSGAAWLATASANSPAGTQPATDTAVAAPAPAVAEALQPWQRRLGKATVAAIRAHPRATELHIRGMRVLAFLPRNASAGERLHDEPLVSPTTTTGFLIWRGG